MPAGPVAGELITDDEKPGQTSQTGRQVKAGELISAKVERLQMIQIRRQEDIGQLIPDKVKPVKLVNPRGKVRLVRFVFPEMRREVK